jgi:hypothetical protein
MAEQTHDQYLVMVGVGYRYQAVAVGPFPPGFNALHEFEPPQGYDTVTSHSTREEAEAEVEWYRTCDGQPVDLEDLQRVSVKVRELTNDNWLADMVELACDELRALREKKA